VKRKYFSDNTDTLIEKYASIMNALKGTDELNEKLIIEVESGTGWGFHVMRFYGVSLYSSKNTALLQFYSDPIQTDDLIYNKSYITYRNPAYEEITIVPGLKLEYPVYDGDNKRLLAKMVREFKESSSWMDQYCSYQYSVFDESNASISLKFDADQPTDQRLLEELPCQEIFAHIYLDKSFVYDSLSLVEQRYVVSVSKHHLQWLPHIFHAYILQLYV